MCSHRGRISSSTVAHSACSSLKLPSFNNRNARREHGPLAATSRPEEEHHGDGDGDGGVCGGTPPEHFCLFATDLSLRVYHITRQSSSWAAASPYPQPSRSASKTSTSSSSSSGNGRSSRSKRQAEHGKQEIAAGPAQSTSSEHFSVRHSLWAGALRARPPLRLRQQPAQTTNAARTVRRPQR